MFKPLTSLRARCFNKKHTAFFLDFDGTLVEVANHPDLVQIAPATKHALAQLFSALGGAVAVITGRDISDVDRYLTPLFLPIAGVHGLNRRSIDGSVHGTIVDDHAFLALNEQLEQFVNGHKGLLFERKSGSVALHYRARPELEQQCFYAMGQAVHSMDGVHVLRGKMVIEAKADSSNKGGAVNDFLAEPPFAGRIPFFAGDDVTDEDAFAVVNARQGISVKIGPGPSLAHYYTGSTLEFVNWLQALARDLEQDTCVEQS